jgi:hypothetical protein
MSVRGSVQFFFITVQDDTAVKLPHLGVGRDSFQADCTRQSQAATVLRSLAFAFEPAVFGVTSFMGCIPGDTVPEPYMSQSPQSATNAYVCDVQRGVCA